MVPVVAMKVSRRLVPHALGLNGPFKALNLLSLAF